MPSKKDELKEKISKLLQVYIFAQEVYLYTEYFHNPETVAEKKLVFESAHKGDIATIRHIMFRTLIVEVAKLFSNSTRDKFQLKSFINSLASSGHYRTIGIPKEHVNQWTAQIQENEEVINNIMLLRSEVYAHTDDPIADYQGMEISFSQIKILLDLAGGILVKIYADVYEKDLFLNPTRFRRNRFALLKLLAKAENDRIGK